MKTNPSAAQCKKETKILKEKRAQQMKTQDIPGPSAGKKDPLNVVPNCTGVVTCTWSFQSTVCRSKVKAQMTDGVEKRG